MNRMRNMRCYLAGAMDRCPDAGVTWRRRLREDLHSLGILWLDPTRKPINIGVEDDESRRLRRENKLAGNYCKVAEEMRPIRAVDLRMVCNSDFLVVNINIDVHACGTYNELTLACQLGMPVLIHVEQGKQECPDWLFACVDHRHIFGTWVDLMKYIRHVAHDKEVDSMGSWLFFDRTGSCSVGYNDGRRAYETR